MDNQKQKRSAGTIALVVLLLIVTIASLVLATYAWAKYSRRESGSATANVARWNVDISSDGSAFTQQYTHVVNGKIAPGTQGSFDVSIALNDTEVCVAYQVLLNGVKYTTGVTGATLDATKMSHLKFFTIRTGDEGAYTYDGLLTPTVLGPSASPAADGSGTIAISGVIDLGNVSAQSTHNATPHVTDNATKNANVPGNSPTTTAVPNAGNTSTSNGTVITKDANGKVVVTKTIYWVWPYDLADAATKYGFENVAETSATQIANVTEAEKEAYDAVDTAAGEGAVSQMQLYFTVKAWQVAPDDANETAANSKTQSTNLPTTDVSNN